MRRLIGLGALALMALPSACMRKPKQRAEVEETPDAAFSVVKVADAQAAPQLLRGFYQLEGGQWRWAARNFAVALKTPDGAGTSGAVLRLAFTLPDAVVQRVGAITLAASVNGIALKPETYPQAGGSVYSRELSATSLLGDAITAHFTVDKALPPSASDRRELALIVTSISLESK